MPWPNLWSSAQDDEGRQIRYTGERVSDGTSSRVYDPVEDSKDKPSNAFTQPQTIAATLVLTAGCLATFKAYRTYLQRIPEATDIRSSYFRRRSVFGKVTSVGDGDNFRIYHTPGGRLAGWGWLPWRSVPADRKELRNKTIHVRLAGIDAPELSHFGRPAQPYSQEALEWLTHYVLGRRVRAYVYKADQYSRVVATVYVWKGLLRRDVGLQMLRVGLATVYEAKSGGEFGEGNESKYRAAEWWAKTKRKGMWASKKKDFESPREYKSRYGVGATGKGD